MPLIIEGATLEVTNDGTGAVSHGAIYKNERDLSLNITFDSTDVDSQNNTFAQKDTIFATVGKKATFSVTTVLGALKTTGSTSSDSIADGIADLLKLSNITIAEGTPVDDLKVFDMTPNSTRVGAGEITIKQADRTIVVEKVASSMSVSVNRGGETELSFDISGHVKSITDGQTNTLSDPVKPKASVLSTTDGINTGLTVDGNIVDPLSFSFGMNLESESPDVLRDTNKFTAITGADHMVDITAYLSAGEFVEGFDAVVAGTEVAIVMDFEDTSDVPIWSLSVPKARVADTPNRQAQNSAYAVSKRYRCRPTSGNDNFTLSYYSDISAV